MTTVTGSVRTLKQTAQPGAQLRWKYKSYPAYVNGSLVSSVDDVVSRCDGLGQFSQALTAGVYELTIDGNDQDKWIITAPDDSSSHDVIALITSPSTVLPTIPSPAVVPNATSTVTGALRTIKDSTGVAKVPTGIFYPADVTELKTYPTDSGNTYATLLARGAGEPKYFKWDNTSAAAEDLVGFTVVKPNDNPANGRWLVDT